MKTDCEKLVLLLDVRTKYSLDLGAILFAACTVTRRAETENLYNAYKMCLAWSLTGAGSIRLCNCQKLQSDSDNSRKHNV